MNAQAQAPATAEAPTAPDLLDAEGRHYAFHGEVLLASGGFLYVTTGAKKSLYDAGVNLNLTKAGLNWSMSLSTADAQELLQALARACPVAQAVQARLDDAQADAAFARHEGAL